MERSLPRYHHDCWKKGVSNRRLTGLIEQVLPGVHGGEHVTGTGNGCPSTDSSNIFEIKYSHCGNIVRDGDIDVHIDAHGNQLR